MPSSALLKCNFDKARNAAAISHCPTVPEDYVLKADSKDVKVSQRLRRWAVLYQFKICGCPPVEEWRGRDGMLSHICNALAIGKENRRHIEKYLLSIVDRNFDKIDPSAGFKHGRPAQIKEDSEEAQLICRALETGGLFLFAPTHRHTAPPFTTVVITCSVPPCSVLPCSVLPCSVLPCSIPPCSILPCSVLPCSIPPCSVHADTHADVHARCACLMCMPMCMPDAHARCACPMCMPTDVHARCACPMCMPDVHA